MAGDAPTEKLAAEYQRLIAEIDDALRKLEDLEGGPASHGATAPHGDPMRRAQAGSRPLATSSLGQAEAATLSQELYETKGSGARIAIIVAVGVVVLAAIGWLIWRASGDKQRPAPVVENTETSAVDTARAPSTIEPATPVTGTVTPVAPVSSILVTPALADYGTIRRGTRATRQFEVTNKGSAPVTIAVARSQCRCLYYEYADRIAPGAKETITVTVDGAKAKPGTLRETVAVTGKKDSSLNTSFEVAATIR
jgi:hypothetical protein